MLPHSNRVDLVVDNGLIDLYFIANFTRNFSAAIVLADQTNCSLTIDVTMVINHGCHKTYFSQWQGSHASRKIMESPVSFIGKFSGAGKSWKMTLVLESPGNLLARFWKVLEFARQWCAWQFLISNRPVYADENSHNSLVRFLGCRYAKNAFTAWVPPRTPLAELTVLSQTP